MCILIFVTIFGSILNRLLALRNNLEFNPEKLKEIYKLTMLYSVMLDIFLGLTLMFMQRFGTGTMNIISALEIGVGAPYIFMKLVEKQTNRNT